MLSAAMPPRLRRALAAAGLKARDLEASQLVLALVRGSSARLSLFYRDGRVWRQNKDLGTVAGYAGRNGLSARKTEGDGCTPAGLFKLGYAFGCREKPETAMPYRSVTKDSFWVDDPESPLYNTWAEGGEGAGWKSAERLWDHKDSYAYAVVVEYNTVPAVRGKGSAIFLHCGRKPTAGCIAVPESAMLEILRWLDPGKKPAILIVAD